MKLVISLPTRGRPQQLINTIKRNLACLSRDNTLLMVQVDEDDTQTVEQVVKKWDYPDKRVMFDVRAREDTIAAKWNRALQCPADVYTCLGDDDPLAMPDSDVKILRAAELFPDNIGMVYGRMANASFSGVISFTKRMTELLGYIQPEYFPYWFCDHWTDDIGRMIGRIVMTDVRTDQTSVGRTQEMREPAWWATWFDANYMIRRQHAHRIIESLDEPAWRKDMQKSVAPQTEYRSRYVNDTVRFTAQREGWGSLVIQNTKDERYLRIKQKAIDAVPGILETLPQTEARIFGELLTPPNTIPNLLRAG